MEALMKALIAPMPLGKVRNNAFGDAVMQIGDMYFFDPAKTLSSAMRALHVMQHVLAADGHVYILNSNPAMRPLMREAAYLCMNSNIWWWTDEWIPGALEDQAKSGALLFDAAKHQPSRHLFAARGMALRNPHCPTPPLLNRPKPSLSPSDQQWMMGRIIQRAKYDDDQQNRIRKDSRDYKELLRNIVRAETDTARLQLPKSLTGRAAPLALLIVLDLTHGAEAVQEAAARNVMTASVLNAHTELTGITYPIFASEFYPRFQHFFLEWLLKVVNMPPRGPGTGTAG